jgi:hypothetical protein
MLIDRMLIDAPGMPLGRFSSPVLVEDDGGAAP